MKNAQGQVTSTRLNKLKPASFSVLVEPVLNCFAKRRQAKVLLSKTMTKALSAEDKKQNQTNRSNVFCLQRNFLH